MSVFTLHGISYEYLLPDPGHVEETRSWEYGKYPKIMATIALTGGETVDVYARAERWNPSHILVRWDDDDRRPHWGWVPAGNVRPSTTPSGTSSNITAAPKTSRASGGGTGSRVF